MFRTVIAKAAAVTGLALAALAFTAAAAPAVPTTTTAAVSVRPDNMIWG